MKCKNCTMDCPYRTSDREKECEFQNRIIQLPDEWQGVRIQAAIAAMQGVMNFFGSIDYNKETIAELAVAQADALIDILKKEANEISKKKPAFEMKTPEESLGIDSETYNKIVDECIYGEQKPYGQREECSNCQMNYAGECKGSCAMKRGEQKPAAWSEEDENMIEAIEALCDDKIRFTEFHDVKEHAYTVKNWLKSLKERVQPKPMQEYDDMAYEMARAALYDKLKNSLRPQSHWKPSDEQMKALYDSIEFLGCTRKVREDLKSLYEQLKKLMEE